MNKKVLLIAVGIVVVIAGSIAFLLLSKEPVNDTDAPQDSLPAVTTTEEIQQPEITTQEQTPLPPGAYTDYQEGVLATTAGTKLLFFHAPWCPQCRALEADITTSGVPNGVTIFKVDYDSNQTLRQKYGVTLQTTIVSVDDNGNLVEKFVAYDDPSLASVIKNLL